MTGLSMSCGLRQEQRQSQRLCLRQRQTLSLQQIQAHRQEMLRLSEERFDEYVHLVHSVWKHRLEPSARCSHCDEALTVTEIVLGFKSGVDDFTTECPKCKRRFEATNLINRRTGEEHAFWCGPQTLERLPGLEALEVEEIKAQQPQIFYSAIFHYGSLLNAFGQRGINYRREKFDWQAKARFCLGQISDIDVSRIFGVRKVEVSKMRRQLSIQRCSRRSIIPANRQEELNQLRN